MIGCMRMLAKQGSTVSCWMGFWDHTLNKVVYSSPKVICRELGLKYAQVGTQSQMFSSLLNQIPGDPRNASNSRTLLSGVSCLSNETRLSQCHHHLHYFCPGSGSEEVASVVCIGNQADLVPDLYTIMSTVYLEDKHLFFLQVTYCVQT